MLSVLAPIKYCQLLRPKERELVTMFNLNSKPLSSDSISPHATYGRLTPCLQSNRHPLECGDLLDQGVSNAFPPFHYWKPYPIEQFSTVTLNFYRCFRIRKCHTHAGIRTVYYRRSMLNKYITLSRSGVRLLPVLKNRVSATPAPHGVL